MQPMQITSTFDPYEDEVGGKFFDSEAYIQYIVGPAGTGKTYRICWKLLKWAMMQEKSSDGNRYYRALVVRNTADMLKTATFATFETAFQGLLQPPIARIAMSPYITVMLTVPMPDETHPRAVLKFEILFRAFDSEDSVRNALGFEYSSVFIDEVSEIDLEVFNAVCMRVGRFRPPAGGSPTHYGILCAANGSLLGHFMEDWARGKNNELMKGLEQYISHPKMFEAFQQPPGLIPPDYEWETIPINPQDWKVNPKAENIKNLPNGFGYYYTKLVNSPAKIYMYVLGLPAPKMIGKVVFPTFSRAKHVVGSSVVNRKQVKHIVLSFDYGLTPCCLIGVPTSYGRLMVIDEVVTERASVDSMVRDQLLPLLRNRYSNPTYDFVTGDPTGDDMRDNVSLSPTDVLRQYGLDYEPPPSGNDITARLEGVRQALDRGNEERGRDLVITDNCETLINALESNYVYKTMRNGTSTGKPDKTHPWSDIADCLQYMVSSYFNFKSEREASQNRSRLLGQGSRKKGKYL